MWTSRLIIVVARVTERELADSELHQSQTNAPYVRLDAIGRALNSLWSHVGACSDEGIGDGIVELTGDAKITELNLSSGVDENVGGFDITVHDAMGAVQVSKTGQHCLCDLAEDVNTNGAKVF